MRPGTRPTGPAGRRGGGRPRLSRRDRGHARLAEPAGRMTRVQDLHLGHRDFADPHPRVHVEVGLLDPAGVERDPPVERRGHGVDGAALHLRPHLVWVDHDPAVDRADEAADPDRAVVGDRHLGDVRGTAPVREAHGDAASHARGKRGAPPGLSRGELQHALVARRLPEERATVLVGSWPAWCASSSTKDSTMNAFWDDPPELAPCLPRSYALRCLSEWSGQRLQPSVAAAAL
jgi:hypothetical protein